MPLVPLTCWWDGFVSQLRAYTVTEMEVLADEVGVGGYSWRAGQLPIGSVPGRLTYLLGYPGGGESARCAEPPASADPVRGGGFLGSHD